MNMHGIEVLHGAASGLPPPPAASGRGILDGPPSQVKALIEEAVAGVFDVDSKQLGQPTRGRAQVALARQAAMYIAHVGCRFSLTEVGEMFERDRTTVSHACLVIEQKRDVPVFDHAIDLLELVIRVLVGPGLTRPRSRN